MTAVRRQGHFFVSMGLIVGASGFQSLQTKYGSLVVLYLPGSYSGHAFEIDKPWVCTPTTTRLTLQSSLLQLASDDVILAKGSEHFGTGISGVKTHHVVRDLYSGERIAYPLSKRDVKSHAKNFRRSSQDSELKFLWLQADPATDPTPQLAFIKWFNGWRLQRCWIKLDLC